MGMFETYCFIVTNENHVRLITDTNQLMFGDSLWLIK